MITPVPVGRSSKAPADAASLTAEYLAFDRRRTARRQYVKAFGGMAIVVLLGAAFGRVAVDHASIVAGLLSLLPAALLAAETVQRRRLRRRLNTLRKSLRRSESHKKIVSTTAMSTVASVPRR